MFFSILLVLSLVACAGTPETSPAEASWTEATAPVADDQVTLRESSIEWETYRYELAGENTLVPGSFDGVSTMQHTLKTWILENKYLKVALVPEFGGRILSIICKPTGHEELYQNPIGTPYGIGEGTFYYDWLMIYGGIFPTFPEPEHGLGSDQSRKQGRHAPGGGQRCHTRLEDLDIWL